METSPKKKSLLREYGEALIVALFVAIVIRTLFFQPFTIPSGSMLETIQIGDYLLVNKMAYGMKNPLTDSDWIYEGDDPRHGDIIVFKYPEDPKIDYIKRVVGVPGDVIEIRNKLLYRNGVAVQEPYVQHRDPNTFLDERDNYPPVTVPEGSFFVMGDNRDNSRDSRYWGFVKKEAIHGKAWRVYWSWENGKGPRFSRLLMKVQ